MHVLDGVHVLSSKLVIGIFQSLHCWLWSNNYNVHGPLNLWMIGFQQVPQSNQYTPTNIEIYHGALKCWFCFETKGLKGCQINWVIWRLTMTTIAYHYIHTSKMKKRWFIKNKVVKHIVKNNGWGDIDPTYPCLVPTNLWKWQCLDGTKPTPYQLDIQVTSIY